jgi:protein-L-isoaspartate(D-aspartate) O-methyltransferase
MDFATARKHMVDSQVRPNDVTDLKLLKALEITARERFVPEAQKPRAYMEMDIPLFKGRWLLEARDFSKLIHAAGISDQDLVLDIGCGYGYSTSILSHIAGMVVALEDNPDIVAEAEKNLSDDQRDNEVVVEGTLTQGKPDQGPFDAIIIAHGVEFVPDELLAQLKDGGRLVTIIKRDAIGQAVLITRNGDDFGHVALFEASPAGILPGFQKESAFSF